MIGGGMKGWRDGEGMMEADVRAWLFLRAGMGRSSSQLPGTALAAHRQIATHGLKGARHKRHQTLPERQDIRHKP